jgi:hypothetical protein
MYYVQFILVFAFWLASLYMVTGTMKIKFFDGLPFFIILITLSLTFTHLMLNHSSGGDGLCYDRQGAYDC